MMSGYDAIVFILGVMMATILICISLPNHMVKKSVLREVGIERIEKCHNVHSNWYEIVWIKEEGK